MRYPWLIASLLLGLPLGAQRAPVQSPASAVTLTYLGTAGWEISDGYTVILVDPYLSRLRRADPDADAPSLAVPGDGDSRRLFGPDDVFISDTAAIDAHIRRADFVLVHHSHSDHLMDVPYIAGKFGATVMGSESTTNAVRAYGLPPARLITVRGGEDYVFGTFSIRVIPSLHSPLDGKHYFDSRVISRTVKAPLRNRDYVEGGSFAYLIRIGGHEILTSGSMNFIERELEGLRPDVAIVGAAPSRRELHDYSGRLLRALGLPTIVLPTHWDNHALALLDDRATSDRLPRLRAFIDEIHAASPRTRVIVPKYFDPIVLPPR